MEKVKDMGHFQPVADLAHQIKEFIGTEENNDNALLVIATIDKCAYTHKTGSLISLVQAVETDEELYVLFKTVSEMVGLLRKVKGE